MIPPIPQKTLGGAGFEAPSDRSSAAVLGGYRQFMKEVDAAATPQFSVLDHQSSVIVCRFSRINQQSTINDHQ